MSSNLVKLSLLEQCDRGLSLTTLLLAQQHSTIHVHVTALAGNLHSK